MKNARELSFASLASHFTDYGLAAVIYFSLHDTHAKGYWKDLTDDQALAIYEAADPILHLCERALAELKKRNPKFTTALASFDEALGDDNQANAAIEMVAAARTFRQGLAAFERLILIARENSDEAETAFSILLKEMVTTDEVNLAMLKITDQARRKKIIEKTEIILNSMINERL